MAAETAVRAYMIICRVLIGKSSIAVCAQGCI